MYDKENKIYVIIGQRLHVGAHNSTGHTPKVYNQRTHIKERHIDTTLRLHIRSTGLHPSLNIITLQEKEWFKQMVGPTALQSDSNDI